MLEKLSGEDAVLGISNSKERSAEDGPVKGAGKEHIGKSRQKVGGMWTCCISGKRSSERRPRSVLPALAHPLTNSPGRADAARHGCCGATGG